IEVHPTMPTSLRDLLLEEFNTEQEAEGAILTREDVYEVVGLLNAAGLLELTAPDRPHLHDPTFVPVVPPRFATGRDLFEVIREGDVLVHHPYESFPATVERFVQVATEDPDVLAIKITLYRIGTESGIARRLVEAAERGKQVAVLIELQARFDEESNIQWATRLQDAGAHVSYGVAGLKTHAKTILVVRREGEGIRRYVHIGTGNYSARNARTYTDFGLFSAREELGADLTDLFNVLTGFATREQYRRIVVAPAGIRPWLLDRISREADHAKAGRPARILAKINALVDQEIILALYEASNAGVQVDLLVRGICCLRPGIAGASERIRVVSVIGRFLEHSRAWWFQNHGEEEVLISSADWMPRNLNRRIEVAVPLEDPAQRTLARGLMEVCLQDNRQAWDLLPNGNYRQRHPGNQPERATHAWLLERYAARTGDRLVLEP
ncbi:MAG: polyphosphate kinase 1, partial [Gemmatimonadota bacterium]